MRSRYIVASRQALQALKKGLILAFCRGGTTMERFLSLIGGVQKDAMMDDVMDDDG
jgi:hypothetical protein